VENEKKQKGTVETPFLFILKPNTFAIVPRKARDIGKGDEESLANP